MRDHSTPPRFQAIKLCECGCGEPTLLARQTVAEKGHQRGQPLRYINGHNRRHSPQEGYWQNGYLHLRRPDHPHANSKGYVRAHRLVMEGVIGRILDPVEVVHHVSTIPSENHPDNLKLYPDNGTHHRAEHGRLMGWSRHHPACVECGTTTARHSSRGRCANCYAKFRYWNDEQHREREKARAIVRKRHSSRRASPGEV